MSTGATNPHRSDSDALTSFRRVSRNAITSATIFHDLLGSHKTTSRLRDVFAANCSPSTDIRTVLWYGCTMM